MSEYPISEARRQIGICNACRYCEGFCSVFPSLQQLRHFSDGDITQLANLCHNCRACHYSCQYAAPHEFQVNLPKVLADTRVDSWQRLSRPRVLSNAFQHHGVLIGLVLVIALTLFISIVSGAPASKGNSFYSYLSHSLMVLIFLPAFVLPLLLTADALRRYWQEIGGDRIQKAHVSGAFKQMVELRNLAGGQGQGCNFEKQDHYSNARRYWHQAVVVGFALCFASTSSGTLMHYLFDMPAPYSWYALPKLLGVPGGILLTLGCTALAYLKSKADRSLGGTNVWGAEMAFVILLGMTGLTGLILYAVTGTAWVSHMLSFHLACVLSLFLLLPYSKMVHGFFRLAALIRDEQTRQTLS